MGLDRFIRDHLQLPTIARDAFLQLRADWIDLKDKKLAKWKASGGINIIENVLGRVNATPGDNDYKFTGIGFASTLMTPMLPGSRNRYADLVRYYVAIMDDQDNVPIVKRDEQVRRAMASKFEPYPRDAMITDNGVTYKDKDFNVVNEQFDIRRMMRSKMLRKRLWEYCELKIHERARKGIVVPANYRNRQVDLFYQFSSKIVYNYGFLKNVPAHSLYTHGQVDDLILGESDLTEFLWVKKIWDTHFLECPVASITMIQTIDNDILPISALFLEYNKVPDGKELYWTYKADKSFIDVDLVLLHKRRKEVMGLGAVSFALFCMFGNFDFLKKNCITKGIGMSTILGAIEEYDTLIEEHWSAKKPSEEEERIKILKKILLFVYKKKANNLLTNIINKEKKIEDKLQRTLTGKAARLDTSKDKAATKKTQVKNIIQAMKWDELYTHIATAAANDETIKAEKAKELKRQKARQQRLLQRKRKADENEKKEREEKKQTDDMDEEKTTTITIKNKKRSRDEEKEEKKTEKEKEKEENRITTSLRPPSEETIRFAHDRMWWTMKYWTFLKNPDS